MLDEAIMLEQSLDIEFLLAAGGGGGGDAVPGSLGAGGGGGAGGLFNSAASIPVGAYAVTIGLGGAIETNGQNSTFLGLTAFGGGRGSSDGGAGLSGGSGGGNGSNTTGPGGLGVAGQGHDAGSGGRSGGGGAVSAGSGQNAGAGLVSVISGASIEYARGGSHNNGGTPQPGWGGGGAFGGNGDVGDFSTGSVGENGILLIRYRGPQRATGGTVTSYTDGSGVQWTLHTFTSNGTFTVTS